MKWKQCSCTAFGAPGSAHTVRAYCKCTFRTIRTRCVRVRAYLRARGETNTPEKSGFGLVGLSQEPLRSFGYRPDSHPCSCQRDDRSGFFSLAAKRHRDLGQANHASPEGQVLVCHRLPQQENRRHPQRGETERSPCPRARCSTCIPLQVSVTLKELGLDHVEGYHITDLYDDYDYGVVTPDRRFKVDVNPSGSECTAVSSVLRAYGGGWAPSSFHTSDTFCLSHPVAWVTCHLERSRRDIWHSQAW